MRIALNLSSSEVTNAHNAQYCQHHTHYNRKITIKKLTDIKLLVQIKPFNCHKLLNLKIYMTDQVLYIAITQNMLKQKYFSCICERFSSLSYFANQVRMSVLCVRAVLFSPTESMYRLPLESFSSGWDLKAGQLSYTNWLQSVISPVLELKTIFGVHNVNQYSHGYRIGSVSHTTFFVITLSINTASLSHL